MFCIPDWMDNTLVYEWRQLLKKKLLIERGWKSDLSGKPLNDFVGCHMHEGLVTRSYIPKSVWWHYKIFHPYNCFLLLPEEHIPHPPSREWCVRRSVERYGLDSVKNWWYNELNWKVEPPFVL